MSLVTTVDATLERVRRDATLGSYGPLYTLQSAVDADDTTLMVEHNLTHITRFSILALDYELVLVTDIAHTAGQITVKRGMAGSTATTHDAGTLVEQDPLLPKAHLLDHAELEIRTWEKQLFRVVTLSLDVTRTSRVYDLAGVDPEGVDFLLEVRRPPVGTPVSLFLSSWAGDTWPKVQAKLLRDMPIADLPSGAGLQLLRYPSSAATLRVAYASPLDLSTFEPATDLVDDVGMDPGWIDILELGLRTRALSGSMSSRSDWRATGDNRDAQQVSLLDLVRGVEMSRSQRDARLADAATKLRTRYPYRT